MDSTQTLESCGVVDDEHRRMVQRGQWIRAAILGANDGLLSTTSLMLGVGAAKEDRRSMVLSGLAGALAGACSMAVGEFVSVSTQRDIERSINFTTNVKIPDPSAGPTTSVNETALAVSNVASTNIFTAKLTNDLNEKMSPLFFSPGRSPMMKVITEDAKTTNTKKLSSPRKENIEDQEVLRPNPFKAAVASAMAFLCGSFVPLLPALLVTRYIIRMVVIVIVTTIALAVFGGFGAHLGSSPIRISAARVVVGGWIAMGITYGLLKPFDRQ
ncbi:hypothetical protein Ddye_029435 [Dipteronia dyeriana]|uniref:Vacuolar iron transporter n=1 Tax=Dipteronia dyeriana TaxID=168575 RepID=A0AAD9TFJ0_9ROSI|nr:hypothetical protein Ddye_029435 [Dipteronia dyeriana]